MRRTLSSSLGLGLSISILGLAGCGTQPIPRVAVKGTTIMFPVPDGFRAGFGRALNQTLEYGEVDPAIESVDPASPFDDFQRGELLFALREGPTTASPRITYLPLRYITRVHLDESSGAALPAELEEYINVGTPVQTGQIVAFVDIPLAEQLELEPKKYFVFVERWRRASSGATNFVQMTPVSINYNYFPWPWIGWANFQPDQGIPIRIVDQDPGQNDWVQELFHQPGGWDKWVGNGGYSFLDHTEDLEHLIPHLKLRISVADLPTLTFPAAWEMTLAYPVGKFEVTGASLGKSHRSGGLVTVTTTGSPSGLCDPGSGTARISVIDPDQSTAWVDLVYRLRDPECGRAVVSDFTPGLAKAYDVNGNLLSIPQPTLDPNYSF